MKKQWIVTTSWDDGCVLDKRIAELLNKYGLKGTFYIQKLETKEIFDQKDILDLRKRKINLQSLDIEDIKNMDKIHEIGAHTLTHPKLTQISIKAARNEIFGSKEYLENLIGHKVQMFCYPSGDFNEDVKNLVREAGFSGARTVKRGIIECPDDCYEFHTTMHVYPHPVKIYFRKKVYGLPLKWMFGWEAQAKRSFDQFLKKGGIWHMWGHSWEIEKFGMWNSLERVIEYVSNKRNIEYLTNGVSLTYMKKDISVMEKNFVK